MNNTKAEEGFEEWAKIEGIAIPVFRGFSGKVQPSDDQTLTIYVKESERVVGPLYRATCFFIIATPPHDEDDPEASLGNHQATVDVIRDLLEDPPESIAPALESTAGLFYRGGFMRDGGENTIEGGRWVTTIDFLAGIATRND